jgi:hypothetical protein
MSFVERGVIEEKEEFYLDFFESKPVSPKKLYTDNSGNIHIRRKPIIIRRQGMSLYKSVSILDKRKLADAFGEEIYNDKDRYGQDIPDDFFNTNVGHDVY